MTIVKLFNLLLHFQRHAICILSVLTNARPPKTNIVEAEHVEWKDLRRNTLTIAQWLGHRSSERKTYFSPILNTCGLQGAYAVYAFYMREGQKNKQTQTQPAKKKPKHHY